MQIKAKFAQKARKPSLVFLNQEKKNWLQSTNLTRGFLETLPKNPRFTLFQGQWGGEHFVLAGISISGGSFPSTCLPTNI